MQICVFLLSLARKYVKKNTVSSKKDTAPCENLTVFWVLIRRSHVFPGCLVQPLLLAIG